MLKVLIDLEGGTIRINDNPPIILDQDDWEAMASFLDFDALVAWARETESRDGS
mgnify:CR=1 FL=1